MSKAYSSSNQRDSTEVYYAEMEAARNDAEEHYFRSRRYLAHNDSTGALFRAGFERAFKLLWDKHRAHETFERFPGLPPKPLPACKARGPHQCAKYVGHEGPHAVYVEELGTVEWAPEKATAHCGCMPSRGESCPNCAQNGEGNG